MLTEREQQAFRDYRVSLDALDVAAERFLEVYEEIACDWEKTPRCRWIVRRRLLREMGDYTRIYSVFMRHSKTQRDLMDKR